VAVARLLAKEFGLKLTVLPGLNIIPEMDTATFTRNFEYAVYGSYGLRYPRDTFPFGTFPETYGRRYPLDIKNSLPQPNDTVQLTLSGVGMESFKGGISRSLTNKPNEPISDREATAALLGLPKALHALMQPEALARHLKICENIDKFFKNTYDLDHLQVGKRWTWHDSAKRHEWVHAYPGLALGNHALMAKVGASGPPEYRGAYKYNFMLIDAFCPKLLSLPFAEKVWHEFAFHNHPEALRISRVKAVPNPGVSVTSNFQKRSYVEAMAPEYLNDLHDDFGRIFDMDKFDPYYSELRKKLQAGVAATPQEDRIAMEIIAICFMNIFMKTSYQIPPAAAPKSEPITLQEMASRERRWAMPPKSHLEDLERLREPGFVFLFPDGVYGPDNYDALPENEQFFLDAIRLRTQYERDIKDMNKQWRQEVDRLQRQVDRLRQQAEHEKNMRLRLKETLSWRITAPLRSMGRLIKSKKGDTK
jgi:hypothetical protein